MLFLIAFAGPDLKRASHEYKFRNAANIINCPNTYKSGHYSSFKKSSHIG